MAIDTEKIADNARWERWQDKKDMYNEVELEAQLAELKLDGTFDAYILEFYALSDEDIAKLDGYYDAGDLCRPLADAWCRTEAH